MVRVENDRVRVAFLHALGNTIVASDMTQARRLAYGRDRAWRVVTLRGELIELSGKIFFCQVFGAFMINKSVENTANPAVMLFQFLF